MKIPFQILLAILIFLFSCKKNSGDSTNPPVIHGKVTPRGTPAGGTIVKTIGPAGGSIASADNSIVVTIPAGAVDSPIAFTVQPITNETPQGIGAAYRLLPEGSHFLKPVTITFRYSDNLLTGSLPELLFPAYQDSSGVWQAITSCVLDMTAKTISVQSRHFSDWSIFEEYELTAEKAVIGTRETDNLKVSHISSLTDLNTPEVPINDPSLSQQVSRWEIVRGGGQLISVQEIAEYTAPSTVPQDNPVAVSATVSHIRTNQGSNGVAILFANILIRDEYMDININGASTQYNYCRVLSPAKVQVMAGNGATNLFCLLQVNGNTAGDFAFDSPQVITGTAASVVYGGTNYISSYTTCQPAAQHATTGSIKITKLAAAIGDYTEGTVTGTLSRQVGCGHEDIQVNIRFRGKRES